ncbi:hypothetical protein BAU15_05140 [Enterococcus sp. JM4C]|nr:hypothetical protein BAU15_05140 [Enterococcus sp. JM4C]
MVYFCEMHLEVVWAKTEESFGKVVQNESRSLRVLRQSLSKLGDCEEKWNHAEKVRLLDKETYLRGAFLVVRINKRKQT